MAIIVCLQYCNILNKSNINNSDDNYNGDIIIELLLIVMLVL